MNALTRLIRDLGSRRSRHLIYLLHQWAMVPFLILWIREENIRQLMGETIMNRLEPMVVGVLVYLSARTFWAYRTGERQPWEYIFPPLDVALITIVLYTTHRGPMSNLTLLYFFPLVAASGALNVRWSLAVGVLVVIGTAIATIPAIGETAIAQTLTVEVLRAERLNIGFRLYFVILIASLMAFQARYSAELKERLAVAADRNRIAMEMHDGVQGRLVGMASQLELIAQTLAKRANNDPMHGLVTEVRQDVRESADELRFLVQRLRSASLADGFVPALRQYCSNLCQRIGVNLEFSAEDTVDLGPEQEAALFRIAQEILTNVAKHAQARSVSVTLAKTEAGTGLWIADDGVGFDPRTKEEGYGLQSIKDRAAGINGTAEIRSKLGEGTKVHIHVGPEHS